jgi:hypothetical protein
VTVSLTPLQSPDLDEVVNHVLGVKRNSKGRQSGVEAFEHDSCVRLLYRLTLGWTGGQVLFALCGVACLAGVGSSFGACSAHVNFTCNAHNQG